MEKLQEKGVIPISINQIDFDPYNPNVMDKESYLQLRGDMKAGKYYDPIEVRKIDKDRFMVIDGNHRLKIASELKWSVINCVIIEVNELLSRIRTLKKHIHRGQRNLIGIAENINLLRKMGHPLDSIASLLNYKQRHVYEILELLDLEDDVKELLRSGAITLKHVNVTSTLKGANKILEQQTNPNLFKHLYKNVNLGHSLQNDMLREVARDKLSVKETKKRVKDIFWKWKYEPNYLIEVGNCVYPRIEMPEELLKNLISRANKEGMDIHILIKRLVMSLFFGKYKCPYCDADFTLGERNCPKCQKLGFGVLRLAKT